MTIEFAGIYSQQAISVAQEYTLWGTSTVGSADIDTKDVVLATKFRTTVNGNVIGIRWQRQSGRLGAISVALWQGTTNISGTRAVDSQTASGWQRQDFDTPVSITSGTLYMASALYDDGRYYATNSFFTSALTVGPIVAVANTESTNGMYRYSSTMQAPNTAASGACYYIDVVFSA